jgi:hypothetical protein
MQQLISQPLEQADGLHTRNHSHQAQQQAQHTKVDVMQVFPIRRNDEHRCNGAHCGNTKYCFFCDEILYGFYHSNTS